ncbi:MAG: holdfast anchoring protein HfaA [Caulobacteraceae bacterium]|nr:holdfast anchoring protein HfaA [Caulobacteraceae bacterium]
MTQGSFQRIALMTAAALAASAVPMLAAAQTMTTNSASFNAGYGRTSGSENRAVDVAMGDANGNISVINGLISGSSSSSSIFSHAGGVAESFSGVGGSSSGSATAIGNSLNVVTSGSYNTVIVSSTQTNTGTITATTSTNGK